MQRAGQLTKEGAETGLFVEIFNHRDGRRLGIGDVVVPGQPGRAVILSGPAGRGGGAHLPGAGETADRPQGRVGDDERAHRKAATTPRRHHHLQRIADGGRVPLPQNFQVGGGERQVGHRRALLNRGQDHPRQASGQIPFAGGFY